MFRLVVMKNPNNVPKKKPPCRRVAVLLALAFSCYLNDISNVCLFLIVSKLTLYITVTNEVLVCRLK